jgi:hypothetical protein
MAMAGRRRSSFAADNDAADFLASMQDLGIDGDERTLEDDADYDLHPFMEEDVDAASTTSSLLEHSVPSFVAHVSKPSMTNLMLSPADQLPRKDDAPSPFASTPAERKAAARAAEYAQHEEYEAELAQHAKTMDRDRMFSPVKIYCGKCEGKGWDAHHPDCQIDLREGGVVDLQTLAIKSGHALEDGGDDDNNNRGGGEKRGGKLKLNVVPAGFGCCGGGRVHAGAANDPSSGNECMIS